MTMSAPEYPSPAYHAQFKIVKISQLSRSSYHNTTNPDCSTTNVITQTTHTFGVTMIPKGTDVRSLTSLQGPGVAEPASVPLPHRMPDAKNKRETKSLMQVAVRRPDTSPSQKSRAELENSRGASPALLMCKQEAPKAETEEKDRAKGAQNGRPGAGKRLAKDRAERTEPEDSEEVEHVSEASSDLGSDVFEVERILDDVTIEIGLQLYHIRWKGLGPADDTWEPEENLNCPKILSDYRRQKPKMRRVNERLVFKHVLDATGEGKETTSQVTEAWKREKEEREQAGMESAMRSHAARSKTSTSEAKDGGSKVETSLSGKYTKARSESTKASLKSVCRTKGSSKVKPAKSAVYIVISDDDSNDEEIPLDMTHKSKTRTQPEEKKKRAALTVDGVEGPNSLEADVALGLVQEEEEVWGAGGEGEVQGTGEEEVLMQSFREETAMSPGAHPDDSLSMLLEADELEDELMDDILADNRSGEELKEEIFRRQVLPVLVKSRPPETIDGNKSTTTPLVPMRSIAPAVPKDATVRPILLRIQTNQGVTAKRHTADADLGAGNPLSSSSSKRPKPSHTSASSEDVTQMGKGVQKKVNSPSHVFPVTPVQSTATKKKTLTSVYRKVDKRQESEASPRSDANKIKKKERERRSMELLSRGTTLEKTSLRGQLGLHGLARRRAVTRAILEEDPLIIAGNRNLLRAREKQERLKRGQAEFEEDQKAKREQVAVVRKLKISKRVMDTTEDEVIKEEKIIIATSAATQVGQIQATSAEETTTANRDRKVSNEDEHFVAARANPTNGHTNDDDTNTYFIMAREDDVELDWGVDDPVEVLKVLDLQEEKAVESVVQEKEEVRKPIRGAMMAGRQISSGWSGKSQGDKYSSNTPRNSSDSFISALAFSCDGGGGAEYGRRPVHSDRPRYWDFKNGDNIRSRRRVFQKVMEPERGWAARRGWAGRRTKVKQAEGASANNSRSTPAYSKRESSAKAPFTRPLFTRLSSTHPPSRRYHSSLGSDERHRRKDHKSRPRNGWGGPSVLQSSKYTSTSRDRQKNEQPHTGFATRDYHEQLEDWGIDEEGLEDHVSHYKGDQSHSDCHQRALGGWNYDNPIDRIRSWAQNVSS